MASYGKGGAKSTCSPGQMKQGYEKLDGGKQGGPLSGPTKKMDQALADFKKGKSNDG